MHSNATIQQQQVYQKKLLQQQQQQMSQFHAASMELVQSPASASSHQTPAPTTSLPVTPRHAITSRMGPPSNSNSSNNLVSNVGVSTLQSNHQQTAGSSSSESTSHFGPGAGLARLHQYTEALKGGPDRQTSEFWKSFVDEFFLPDSRMHLVLWNPTTHEHKGFGEFNDVLTSLSVDYGIKRREIVPSGRGAGLGCCTLDANQLHLWCSI